MKKMRSVDTFFLIQLEDTLVTHPRVASSSSNWGTGYSKVARAQNAEKRQQRCRGKTALLHPGSQPYMTFTKVEEKKETHELAKSGIKSLIFIHDFCVMVHNVAFDKNGKVIGNITFDENGNVKGMGTKIPEQKRTFNRYIQFVQISMYQLTDRIASIQLGSVREESEEYKHYLYPGKTVQQRLSLGTTIQMPKPKEAFPDLAKYLTWTPPMRNTPRMAVALEEAVEEAQHEEDNPTLSKSPGKSKGKRKHDEGQEMSTVSGRTNQKKARGEVTKLPRKIPDRERTESTAAVSHTSEHISQCTSIFQNEYRKATSEGVKNNLCWEVLKVYTRSHHYHLLTIL